MSSFDDLTSPVEGTPPEPDRARETDPNTMQGGDPGGSITDPDGSLGTDSGQFAGGGVGNEDVERGNLDGSNATEDARDQSLDQARGNGSFDNDAGVSGSDEEGMASDAGQSGQDNGLNT